MKKFKLILLMGVTMFAGLSFTSCDKEEDNDPTETYYPGSSSSNSGTENVSHKHDLDYWQTQYNICITMIIDNFMQFDAAKKFGDTVKARELQSEIKRLQAEAKQTRLDAKSDGWTIKQDPYETKSAYL